MTEEEIRVLLTATTDQFNAKMTEAAATVQDTQAAMAASITSLGADFNTLDDIMAGHVKKAGEVANAEAALDRLMAAGAISAKEQAAALDALNLSAGMVAPAIKETEVAANGLADALTRNSRTAYSVSALISDAMTGQFSRMRREIAAVANETGAMTTALRYLIGPVGLAAVAAGGFGFAAMEGATQASEMERALLATGDASGETYGELKQLQAGMVDADTSAGAAAKTISALALSGQFAGQTLETAARAAQQMAELTGESMDQAAKAIEQLGKDPAKAIEKLNEQFQFLSVPEAEEIARLLKLGQNAEAAAAAVRDLQQAEAQRLAVAGSKQGYIGNWWDSFKGGLHSITAGIESWGAPETLQDKLDKVQTQIDDVMARNPGRIKGYGSGHAYFDTTGMDAPEAAYVQHVNDLLQQQEKLRQQIAEQEKKTQATAEQTVKTTKQVSDILDGAKKHGHAGGSGSADEQAFQQAQYAAQQQGHEMSLAEQKTFWQKRLEVDQAGGAADANAAANAIRHVVEIQRQMDRQSEVSGREAARKRTEAAQQEARKEEQAAKTAARARLALDEQQVESAHQIATAKIANTLQADKLQAASGKITAAQMVHDQIAALQEQLAADVQYYQAKEKLAAGNAADEAKWNAAIVIDQLKTQQAILKIQEDYRKATKRIGDEILSRRLQDDRLMIDSGFREVNALIAGQETWRQAVLNIGEMVLQREEDNIAKGIALALSGENAKTGAVEMSTTERLALNMAAEAKALAIQGETAIKWITTEAAKAAAGAFSAMASIPVVGPALAVAAGVAIGAEVLHLIGNVASAQGGWERVPVDGMTTVLHKDEMVLPKHVADPVRNMARRGGSGGGGDNFTVYAQDARGLADFIRRHGGTLGDSLRRLGRNGHAF